MGEILTSSHARLYPRQAVDVRVVPSLPAPRLAAPPPDQRNLGDVRSHYGANLMLEMSVDGKDRIAVIDKAFPHSRYDLLLLASNDDAIRSSVTDLAPGTAAMVFETAARFVDFLGEPDVIDRYGLADGHLHLSYNYDPYTVDRENSMFYDKRFHLHLNYTPGRDLRLAPAVRWGAVRGPRLRRRLLDPIAYLATLVLHDATGGQVAGVALLPVDDDRDATLGLPVGVKVRLADGWGSLRTPRLVALLSGLHAHAEQAYRALHRVFTGAELRAEPWRRPRLRPRAEIDAGLRELDWLSPRSRFGLSRLAAVLRDLDDDQIARFRRDESARVHQMAVAGLDYAMSIYSRHRNSARAPLARADEAYLVMQFRMFGDIGGAGLPAIGAIPVVRVDRAAGPTLSVVELLNRRALRREFLDRELPGLRDRFALEILG